MTENNDDILLCSVEYIAGNVGQLRMLFQQLQSAAGKSARILTQLISDYGSQSVMDMNSDLEDGSTTAQSRD